MRKIRQKGSYTIEASIWISFILLMYITVLKGGITLFQQVKQRESLGHLKEMNIVKEFYQYQIAKELGEILKNDEQ